MPGRPDGRQHRGRAAPRALAGAGRGLGSPAIGGGAVWVNNIKAGILYELNPATGAVRDSVRLGAPLPHFASLSLAGPMAFVGTDHGVTAVRGA